MKETLLCSLLLVGAAQADEVDKITTEKGVEPVVTENRSTNNAAAESTVSESESAAEIAATTEAEPSMSGFYAGLGFQYTHTNGKIRAVDGIDADGYAIQVNTELSRPQIDKFGGTFVAGYGHSFGNFYLGGEALLDMNNDDKNDRTYTDQGNVHPYYLKVNGIVPSIALRIGGWCPRVNSLIYAKVGAAMIMLRATVQEKSDTAQMVARKMNKITPIVGLGFEKNIHGHLSIRGELEYRFQAKSTTQTHSIESAYQYNVETRLKGLALRAMLVYRF